MRRALFLFAQSDTELGQGAGGRWSSGPFYRAANEMAEERIAARGR